MYVCMRMPTICRLYFHGSLPDYYLEFREQGILLRAEEILCDIQQLVPSVHVCMSVCLLVLYE